MSEIHDGHLAGLDELTRRKLAFVCEALVGEFPDVPQEAVRQLVDRMTGDLLAEARFTDFLPVLVQRVSRERLRELRDTEFEAFLQDLDTRGADLGRSPGPSARD